MKSKALRRFVAAALVAAPLCLVSTTNSSAAPNELNHRSVMSIRGAQQGSATPSGRANRNQRTSTGISYHNGPVMTSATGTNAYVIWYGTWASSKQAIITDFLTSVGGSPYFNINTTYKDGAGKQVANSVHYLGSASDAGSLGTTNLSDAQIQSIVSSTISSGALPADKTAVYFVLTGSDVSKSGFLTQYCGWHTYGTIASTNIKYSFVGDPSANLSACAAQTTSPNGDAAADAMVSVIAHELEEAVTDPNLNAWYDSRGYENADKCAWTFGTTYTAANGSLANMKLGARDYLIQRNWVNAGTGGCLLKYP